jgi:hypothetical protein
LILSVHVADVPRRAGPGMMLRRPAPSDVPGLRYAEIATAIRLNGSRFPMPQLGRVILIAAWDDDPPLDDFLSSHPVADRFAHGWHARLEPLRASGYWPALPDFPTRARPHGDREPVAVLTLGRLRLRNARRFERMSNPAEDQLRADPAFLAGTGLSRAPNFSSTFSLWRSAAEMRAYAYGKASAAHRAAIRAQRERPILHESLFARFRPYASEGLWDGRDPLEAVTLRPRGAMPAGRTPAGAPHP